MDHKLCPDSGACHHDCADGHCFRVRTCEPLSGVFSDDRWPDDIKAEFGKSGDPKLEDAIVFGDVWEAHNNAVESFNLADFRFERTISGEVDGETYARLAGRQFEMTLRQDVSLKPGHGLEGDVTQAFLDEGTTISTTGDSSVRISAPVPVTKAWVEGDVLHVEATAIVDHFG